MEAITTFLSAVRRDSSQVKSLATLKRCLERGYALRFHIFQNFEILLLQARDGITFAIGCNNIDGDQMRSGSKRGDTRVVWHNIAGLRRYRERRAEDD